MMFLNDFIFFLPELYITFCLLVILVIGAIIQKNNINTNSAINYVSKFTFGIMPLLIIILLFQPKFNSNFVNMLFYNSQISLFSKLLISVLFLMLSLIFISYYKIENINMNFNYEYPVLMLLSILGMFMLISSNDFLILFLGIELQSLSLYVLAASKKNVISSLESGLKYFVLGAFSSGIILLGISFIYGASGMTNFNDIKYFILETNLIEQNVFYIYLIGFTFILVGLFFKLPAAPFHSWAPDVYTGAPTAVTAFFSIIPKIAIFTVIIKLLYITFFSFSDYWSFYLVFCSLCSFVVGSMGALYNVNLKRLMVYGTINHIGFILLALSTVSVEGIQASLFYITIYLILNLNFFSIILSLRSSQNYRVLQNITDFSVLFYKQPILSTLLILNLFSMAGIPPLSGFFSKFYVLYCSMNSDMVLLSMFAVVISVVSCFYYIRMVKTSLFEFENINLLKVQNLNSITSDFTFVIITTSLFNLLFFINPNFLLSICYIVSQNLFS